MTKPAAGRAAPGGSVDPGDADALVTALLTASRVLVGVSARSLHQVEDRVTVTQFRTLVVLDGHESLNLNQLAAALAVTPSTALRMIDRLLLAALVTRTENPANRREVVLALTSNGSRLVRRVTEARRAEIAVIVEAIPKGQRTALVHALRAFAVAAGEVEPRQDDAAALGW